MTLTENLFNNSNYWSEIDGPHLIEVKADKFVGFRSLKEHNFFELLLFLSGEGTIEINGISYDISAGTFCFLTPFHLSKLTVKGKLPLKYLGCRFDWSYIAKERVYPIPQIKEINDFLTLKPYVHCNSDEFALVLGTFEQLYNEYRQQQDNLASLFIKIYVMSLCRLHSYLSNKYDKSYETASSIIQLSEDSHI